MIKKIFAVLAALVMTAAVFGCAGEGTKESSKQSDIVEPGTKEVRLTDMIGREVVIKPGTYRRVVCIGAGALRMYSYVGDVSLLAGVEDIDNLSLEERPKMFDAVARPYVLAYGDVFKTLPSCGVGGPNAQAAEAEKILSCNPDIVISEYEDKEKEDALEKALGVPVVTLKSGPNGVFDDSFRDSMTLLGVIFERQERARDINVYIAKSVEALQARIDDTDVLSSPTIYISGLGNWGTTNHLMTAENYKPFEIAKVKNAADGLGTKGIHPIEKEKFVELGERMGVMIFDAAAVKNIKPLYQEDPTMFDTCKAWKDGEVYLEMAYNAYYTNYEIALINTWYIASIAYPEKFKDVSMIKLTNEVTMTFLQKELADEIFSSPMSYGGYQKIDTDKFFN
ncbi:MAG: ABC transporter substrate-binding protein [Lachnospiraceae bacterium]|nr:ABC transporter substrate-binding protein [Lachnospiraceae bacterium]